MIGWLYTQKRWSPEVAIIFGAAARYRRATVGSSHGNATRVIRRNTRGRFAPRQASNEIELELELELELIKTQMAQNSMLRAEVHARALRASQNVKKAEKWVGARCA
jgi:hypothetical protein